MIAIFSGFDEKFRIFVRCIKIPAEKDYFRRYLKLLPFSLSKKCQQLPVSKAEGRRHKVLELFRELVCAFLDFLDRPTQALLPLQWLAFLFRACHEQ